ncbi:hypothetical protein VNO77_42955 [Canavalia gladiata]|uniref:Uncharacterized protein n=1 Tax=Canavalia gladiata TaxID=3824 RepID=A0AAN9JW01_CANGL
MKVTNTMDAMNLNSNFQILSEEEEFQTASLKRTHSSLTDEVICLDPLSYSSPDVFDNDDDIIQAPTREEKENLFPIRAPELLLDYDAMQKEISVGVPEGLNQDRVMIETSSKRSNSRTKKVRRPKTPPEWLQNWNVRSTKRKDGRFDKVYYHKEIKGFRCRSLKAIEIYETQGIRTQPIAKTRGKRRDKNNAQNETKKMLVKEERDEERETEEIIAQRKREAEKLRIIVEEFLAEVHYNQLHMHDP